MKHISILAASMLGMLILFSSCNDEWKDEQYEHYISFKSPLNDDGVTEIYIPYTRTDKDDDGNVIANTYADEGNGGVGISDYDLPVIVSGSTTNSRDITVYIATDPDTLETLNYENFQLRTDLYYTDLTPYTSFPESITINSGEDVGLLPIKFYFEGIDMVNKWLLPLRILDETEDPDGEFGYEYDYLGHPRKNYAKALLRVFPYNSWSGNYSGTSQQIFVTGDDANASAVETVRLYVVDENTVFFYPGTIDEDRTDRAYYKVYLEFEGDETMGQVNFTCPNESVQFETTSQATYSVIEEEDEVQDYILHRYIIISNIGYSFVDYTSVLNYELGYSGSGSLTLERKINTEIPDEDQAIDWE